MTDRQTQATAHGVFGSPEFDAHEEVAHFHDAASGLRAIIAVHSTALGPGLGGARFRPYASEADALDDVLRLSRAMTYKAALAGLDLGGGKAVLLGDPARDKTAERLRAFGRMVDALGGRYVTAEDVGTTLADMDLVRQETRHVTGVSVGLGGSGDPSQATALGMLLAMQAVAKLLWGSDDLAGRHVVVLGVGKVGSGVARRLAGQGARLTLADVDERRAATLAAELGASAVPPEAAAAVPCDILSPCALSGLLEPATIERLACAAVVGAANNQLATPGCALLLRDRGILYVPDYAANAGGIINIAEELHGPYEPERARKSVERVYDTVLALCARAEADGLTPAEAADRMARERIAAGR